jgi:hypothetical protein
VKPKVITCRVMLDEFRALMPEGTEFEVFEISLHVRPALLRTTLQAAVDAADGTYDPIYLGYGLCSQAVSGVVAQKSRLVVFRTDDCIGIFLGSRQAQRERALTEPGSYFLTRGYIGDGTGSVFDEHARMEQRYGAARAASLFKKMLAHYRRIIHIIMPGSETVESDRRYARHNAERFGLDYVEIDGTDALIRRMVEGGWDGDILVVPPGQPITLEAMLEK